MTSRTRPVAAMAQRNPLTAASPAAIKGPAAPPMAVALAPTPKARARFS
jgi:hypothetical protein